MHTDIQGSLWVVYIIVANKLQPACSSWLTCKELELGGLGNELFSILVGTCQHHPQVVVHKRLGVLLGRPKVDEVQLVSMLVVQEVAPVGVSLHEAPAKELAHRQPQQQRANIIADVLGHGLHLQQTGHRTNGSWLLCRRLLRLGGVAFALQVVEFHTRCRQQQRDNIVAFLLWHGDCLAACGRTLESPTRLT